MYHWAYIRKSKLKKNHASYPHNLPANGVPISAELQLATKP
jgi:hypothetical protein